MYHCQGVDTCTHVSRRRAAGASPRRAQEEAKAEHKKDQTADIVNFGKYVAGAVALGAGIWAWKGPAAGQEYFAGYLLEQSLSIDNLFVFLLCFNFFKTPKEVQGTVLNYGIYSAAVLRLVMILAGVQLVENFQPLLLVFAAVLVYSSANILFGPEEEEEQDLSENFIVKAINKVRPRTYAAASLRLDPPCAHVPLKLRARGQRARLPGARSPPLAWRVRLQ